MVGWRDGYLEEVVRWKPWEKRDTESNIKCGIREVLSRVSLRGTAWRYAVNAWRLADAGEFVLAEQHLSLANKAMVSEIISIARKSV